MKKIEIKQTKVDGPFFKFVYRSNGSVSSQWMDPVAIKKFLKGKNWKAGKLPDGRKIIVLK